MRKEKKKIGVVLLEGLAEIVLVCFCFGIGALVIRFFGVNLDSPNIDGDLIILLGIMAIGAIFGVISALVHWFKKMISNKSK